MFQALTRERGLGATHSEKPPSEAVYEFQALTRERGLGAGLAALPPAQTGSVSSPHAGTRPGSH